jgi:hypothetical protein
MCSDSESRELNKEAEWRIISEQEYVSLEFISDSNVLLRYIQACRRHNIPIRLLFVESDYNSEVWAGPDIPKSFLGFEYNTIPLDNQVIADLFWYQPLFPFRERLNSWGLFSSEDDVMSFKNAYDQAYAQGEIGDGDMETHIFGLFEVQVDYALRCLLNDANSVQD